MKILVEYVTRYVLEVEGAGEEVYEKARALPDDEIRAKAALLGRFRTTFNELSSREERIYKAA